MTFSGDHWSICDLSQVSTGQSVTSEVTTGQSVTSGVTTGQSVTSLGCPPVQPAYCDLRQEMPCRIGLKKKCVREMCLKIFNVK